MLWLAHFLPTELAYAHLGWSLDPVPSRGEHTILHVTLSNALLHLVEVG